MPEAPTLDPWGRAQVKDYGDLVRSFGIAPFEPLLARVPKPMRLMARRIIFGHRDYDRVLEAMAAKRPFGAITGFMPSGPAHLGAKMVMEEMVYHQERGGDVTVAIADMEAHAVRGVPWERCREWGVEEYLLSLVALGLKPHRARIYFQSENRQVQDLAFRLAKEANYSELKAIYGFTGETTLAHMLCPAVQAADILAPQLPENGGPRPLVVPVGVDQDPHIRLTRDMGARANPFVVEADRGSVIVRWKDVRFDPAGLVEALAPLAKKRPAVHKLHVELPGAREAEVWPILLDHASRSGTPMFLPPASLYHRFMSGLTGGKMSSSVPDSTIALSEPPEAAAAKVLKAKTGGRATEAEQRRRGGEPERCAVFELMHYHLDDDGFLEDMEKQCRAGTRLCGPCKGRAAERMKDILQGHQEKREEARERLDDFLLDVE